MELSSIGFDTCIEAPFRRFRRSIHEICGLNHEAVRDLQCQRHQRFGGAPAGRVGSVIAVVTAGIKTHDALTILTLIDDRSGVQISVAEGSARNTDFAGGFGAWFGACGSAKGYTDTLQGKVVVAAYVDS